MVPGHGTLVSVNIFSDGQVQVVLRGSCTAKGQWTHQASAAALFILMKHAYVENDVFSNEDWCTYMCEQHPQFAYWCIVFRRIAGSSQMEIILSTCP